MGRTKKAATIPECGTEDSLYAEHDWSVWDEHYRHCRQCDKYEAVGVSEQASKPKPEIVRGRGHIHQWRGHPFWSSTAIIEVQYCRCGASRAVTRQPEKPVYMPPTMVTHVRRDAFDIYIGRPMARYPDLKAVGWGNPFKPAKSGPGVDAISDAIAAYREWLLKTPALLERLPELRGKVLGCWCAPKGGLPGNLHGTVCHGEVLAWLADHPEDVEAQTHQTRTGGAA
jgi:uncharacterized protein DUF4326